MKVLLLESFFSALLFPSILQLPPNMNWLREHEWTFDELIAQSARRDLVYALSRLERPYKTYFPYPEEYVWYAPKFILGGISSQLLTSRFDKLFFASMRNETDYEYPVRIVLCHMKSLRFDSQELEDLRTTTITILDEWLTNIILEGNWSYNKVFNLV